MKRRPAESMHNSSENISYQVVLNSVVCKAHSAITWPDDVLLTKHVDRVTHNSLCRAKLVRPSEGCICQH